MKLLSYLLHIEYVKAAVKLMAKSNQQNELSNIQSTEYDSKKLHSVQSNIIIMLSRVWGEEIHKKLII